MLCSRAYEARAASRGLGSALGVAVVGIEFAFGSGDIGSTDARSLQPSHPSQKSAMATVSDAKHI